MKRIGKFKTVLKEWIVFTLIFFFLYDVIWAISDFEDFKSYLDEHCLWLLADFGYCSVFSLVSLSVNQRLLRQRFFKMAETERKRFLYSIAIIVAINIPIAGFFELLLDVIDPGFIEDVWGTFFLFGIIASLLALIHMLLHYSDVVIRRNKENISLQKKYLKLQLDPHFVFNSLSSLAGMIEENPGRAEEYVVRLSQVYRYTLRNIDQDFITIDEAMDFAQTYVSMLNLRYDGKIMLETDNGDVDGNDKILAMSLQLLIENAVKHNQPQQDKPLCIKISVSDTMLIVRNNRIYAYGNNDQTCESYGIGLKNLRQRYELECGRGIDYNVTRDSFEIRLPIIKKHQ